MNDDHQQAEREFFDRYYLAHQESKPSLNGFYALSAGARTYGDRVLEHCAGLRVLEYGCGLGGYALRLAERGADVTGIDISDAAIEQASRRAAALGPGVKIRFQNADAEALPFDNASFDLICGSGILHHLDIHRALSEVRRVLAPGGRALFYEPGAHHPAARLYRHLTPESPYPRRTSAHPRRSSPDRVVFPLRAHRTLRSRLRRRHSVPSPSRRCCLAALPRGDRPDDVRRAALRQSVGVGAGDRRKSRA